MAQAKEEGRARLDASLMATPLAERAGVMRIIRDQLSRSPLLDKQYHAWTKQSVDKVAEKRAAEVWTFLEALKSARQELVHDPEDTRLSWKIKEETDCMRVMYRPGLEGTPFHTYCVEGIVNGPMVNAVCVAWEAPSYSTWWPQFTVPTFKIIESKWLKRVRVGEDLSRIRVKVPWPLAPREVLMTQFELEYFEDDITLVLLGTAPSDPDDVEEEIFGFSSDELPPMTQDVVRIDVAGGFILQKITSEQSFFRTIVDIDIKLDYVPPWIINFITRQLVGNGYRLYQKAVLAASKPTGNGKVFQQLISRELLYSRIKSGIKCDVPEEKILTKIEPLKEKEKPKMAVAESNRIVPVVENRTKAEDRRLIGISEVTEHVAALPQLNERLQVKDAEGGLRRQTRHPNQHLTRIDPEVEWALDVLDKMINFVDEWKSQSVLDSSFHQSEQIQQEVASEPDSLRRIENEDVGGDGGAPSGSNSVVKSGKGLSRTTSSQNGISNSAAMFYNREVGCFGSGRKQLQSRPKQQLWTFTKTIRFGKSLHWRRVFARKE